MTTAEQATEMALALPGVEQKGHFGTVDFRVRNKVFASLPAPAVMTVRLDPELARILVESDPVRFALNPGVWGLRGWTRVTLSRIPPTSSPT
jgi:hypothetical protein